MSKRANQTLLRAVLEPRKQGALKAIAEACAAGADPNALCPECSTSAGFVPGGSTLLTHSVREGASLAVEKLLECEADPNLQDQNGWTPWMASALLDGRKRERIQGLLRDRGVEPVGERVGQLFRAAYDGDLKTVDDLIDAHKDSSLFSSFRVDLVARQISVQNLPMLALLLKHGVKATSIHLVAAVRARFAPAVDLLLQHRVPAESGEEEETPLMVAASIGDLEIVQRLIDAGADLNRGAFGDVELTAAFYARAAGHGAVADWLTDRMDSTVLAEIDALREGRDPKYQALYDVRTSGEGLSTGEIVTALAHWDAQHGIDVTDVTRNSVAIAFRNATNDLDALYAELKHVCPALAEEKPTVKKQLLAGTSVLLWWD